MDTIKTRKNSIVYIRALLSLTIILLGAYNYTAILSSKQYIIFYLFLVVASNILFIMLPLSMYEGVKLHYYVFTLDFIIIALGVYWLAQFDIYFLIFIFLTIFMAAVGQSVKLSLLIALILNALYIFIKGTAGGQGFIIGEAKTLMNIPFLFVVALHSSYIAEKANEDTQERKHLERANAVLTDKVKNVSEELNGFLVFTSRVYDSFRDGLIIVDEGGVIRTFNVACENIFNVRRTKLLNMSINTLDSLGEIKELILNLRFKKEPAFDREITIETPEGQKKALVNTMFIRDRSENPIGVLCTIKQVITKIERGV